MVVSWKEAAEMKEDVVREAWVMPSTMGSAVAGLRVELVLVDLLALEEGGAAGVDDADLAEHLAHDGLEVLVVDADALVAVDVLNFVDEVVGQILLALGLQDVVQLGAAFGERVAGFHVVAVGSRDVLAARNQIFLGLAELGRDDELALALGLAGVGDGARDFGDHGHFLGLADFEELGDAGKAADDVLGLGGFAGTAGDDVALPDLVAVLDHDDGAHGQVVHGVRIGVGTLEHVARRGIDHGDGGLEVPCGAQVVLPDQ